MDVREIVCGQAVLVGEAVQVGHGRVCNDVAVIVVFLDNNEYVAEARALTGRWPAAADLSNLSHATRQGKDAESKPERATYDSGQSERADPMTASSNKAIPSEISVIPPCGSKSVAESGTKRSLLK